MKTQVKTPVLVAVAVVLLGGIGYWGVKSMGSAGDLDQGQIKYTPGKPPWLENGGGNKAQPPGGAPVIDNSKH